MSGHDLRDLDQPTPDRATAGGGVPGKRTLTQSIPSLGPQREVMTLDSLIDFPDTRATIDTKIGSPGDRLSERKVRRAMQANPRWHRRLKFDPSAFGGGAVASEEFARAVADKQAQLGVNVDGVAGPRTVKAAGAQARKEQADAAFEATRGTRDPAGPDRARMWDTADYPDTRSVIERQPSDDLMDPFADDDPFGMHLIGRAE